ncbi:MAG: histidine kinase dimerization/phospho-acceptor domain-containing protein, partial [Candidatus Omnitrophica bacterium]|nr:histidine kinase dimerization/phospho-acceptor domain-containing protein [Candidatus Omnitrophota bacterium]
PVKQNSLDEHLSSIKHELRNILVVIQEGKSQVLDGLGNKDCQKCYKMLNPVLESAKELDGLIDQLLSTARFESMLDKYKENTKISADDLEIFKKELVGVISHVIRTPLTVIKEGLSLMLDEIPGKLTPKQKQIVTMIKENTDRLVVYTERVLKTSWNDTIKEIGSEVYYQSIFRDNKD